MELDRLEAKPLEKSRISLVLLGAAAFMVIADVRVIDPLLHVIADEFSAGVGSTAIIVTAYAIPYGLFQLMYGPLGDRIGKLKVMTTAMAAFALGTAACAVVPNLLLLTLLRFLTGMVAAAIIPLSLAYIGDNFPYAERQAAIGRYLTAIMLGQIFSTSIGGIFGEYLGWRGIFLMFGLASLGIAAALWSASRQVTDPKNKSGRRGLASFSPYFQLLARSDARIIIIGVLIEGLFLFGSFGYVGSFLRDRFNLPYATIGILLGGFGIGGLIYSASVHWLIHKLGEQRMIWIGGGLMAVGNLAIAFSHIWQLFIPVSLWMGLGFYMFHSTLQTQATELSPESRGTAVSLFAFSLFMGQGIGVAILGRIVDTAGYVPCFVLAGISIAVLAAWLVVQLRRLDAQA
jgi:predicted MFS family arabinose efflux permease